MCGVAGGDAHPTSPRLLFAIQHIGALLLVDRQDEALNRRYGTTILTLAIVAVVPTHLFLFARGLIIIAAPAIPY